MAGVSSMCTTSEAWQIVMGKACACKRSNSRSSRPSSPYQGNAGVVLLRGKNSALDYCLRGKVSPHAVDRNFH